jgi:hypothetical protein
LNYQTFFSFFILLVLGFELRASRWLGWHLLLEALHQPPSHHTFKEELKTIRLHLFHKVERKGMLPNSFHEASVITVIPKSGKETIKKENIDQFP